MVEEIYINGSSYSAKQLCLDWFKMSSIRFRLHYGFTFNPCLYPELYEWGLKKFNKRMQYNNGTVKVLE